MNRLAYNVLGLLLCAPLGLGAQQRWNYGTTLAQADALNAAGEVERAIVAYQQVLDGDPDNARAMFQLARLLENDAPRAVRLLRGYVNAEPGDPWGYWALGEALERAGDLEAAADALATARQRAPAERDFVVARAEVLAQDGRHRDAAEEYATWLAAHPRDAEALRAQGEQLRRARRLRAARAAFDASLQLDPDEVAVRRLDAIRAELAPSVEPSVRVTHDSDGNTMFQGRLDAHVWVGEGKRIGISGTQLRGDDPSRTTTSWHALIGFDWAASQGTGLEAYAGVAELPTREMTPLLRLRARLRPRSGPAAEVRFQHAPITSTPHVLANPVLLSEARGSLDLPVAGPLVVRGLARSGRLTAEADTNARLGYGGGILLRGASGEIGPSYQLTRYRHAANVGYFAPRQVESVELAVYTEIYRAWPFTFVLDGGVGGERVTDWEVELSGPGQGSGQGPGQNRSGNTGVSPEWKLAARLWSMVSLSLGPARELRLETEAYDTQAGPALAPTNAGWRWGSAALSLRTALR